MIERMMQYFKDRTESLDDYYPCIKNKKRNCIVEHAYYWIKLFVYIMQKSEIPFYSKLEVK
jgi:putative transposase